MGFIGKVMTKKTKEAIKTTAAIVLVIAAVLALWIYPLNQAGKIVTRPEDRPEPYVPEESGLTVDSLDMVTEDNIRLSAFFCRAAEDIDSVRGTVFLLHGLKIDGSSQLAKAQALTADGFQK